MRIREKMNINIVPSPSISYFTTTAMNNALSLIFSPTRKIFNVQRNLILFNNITNNFIIFYFFKPRTLDGYPSKRVPTLMYARTYSDVFLLLDLRNTFIFIFFLVLFMHYTHGLAINVLIIPNRSNEISRLG